MFSLILHSLISTSAFKSVKNNQFFFLFFFRAQILNFQIFRSGKFGRCKHFFFNTWFYKAKFNQGGRGHQLFWDTLCVAHWIGALCFKFDLSAKRGRIEEKKFFLSVDLYVFLYRIIARIFENLGGQICGFEH